VRRKRGESKSSKGGDSSKKQPFSTIKQKVKDEANSQFSFKSDGTSSNP
jgi:hypothetical protein